MGREGGKTRRQQVMDWLMRGEWTFEELRDQMGVPVSVLQQDLRHVEKSARHLAELEKGRLRVTEARCRECGFAMTRQRRFTAPGRCPKCRSERFEAPLLSLE